MDYIVCECVVWCSDRSGFFFIFRICQYYYVIAPYDYLRLLFDLFIFRFSVSPVMCNETNSTGSSSSKYITEMADSFSNFNSAKNKSSILLDLFALYSLPIRLGNISSFHLLHQVISVNLYECVCVCARLRDVNTLHQIWTAIFDSINISLEITESANILSLACTIVCGDSCFLLLLSFSLSFHTNRPRYTL